MHFKNDLGWEWRINEELEGSFGEDLGRYIVGRGKELERREEGQRVRDMRARKRNGEWEAEVLLEEFREGACGGGEEVTRFPAGLYRRVGEIAAGCARMGVECLVGEEVGKMKSRVRFDEAGLLDRNFEPWVLDFHGEMQRSRVRVRVVVCVLVVVLIICTVIALSVLFCVRSV